MGNYRFKLSDMIPNAWFYKLHKEMNRSSNNTLPLPVPVPVPAPAAASTKKKHHFVQHLSDLPRPSTQPNNHSPTTSSSSSSSSSSHPARKSYYFPRSGDNNNVSHQHNSSITRPKSRPSSATASVDSSTTTKTQDHYSPHSSSSSSILLFESSPELRLDRVLTPETTSLCEYGPAANDLVDHDNSFLPNNNNNNNRLDDMLDELELELPRIVTKPAVKLNYRDCIYSQKRATHKTTSSRSKLVPLHHHNNNIRSTPRRLSVLSPGKKIKIRSPKIEQARRMSTSQSTHLSNKRPLSDTFAIVKSSFDPHRDFRESMLEMIVEHNIKGSKDLEDLLACYLSLNSDEYHHLIIKVFKQIWFDLTDIN